MYKLYAIKAWGSVAVEALLAETGAPHEVVDVARNPDGSLPDWLLRLNPAAQIPVMELPDGTIMTESGAMMIYLADAFPQARLAPGVATSARARYLRWMLFLAAALYTADMRVYTPARYSTDPSHAAAIKAQGAADMAREFQILADALGAGPYLLGDTFSAVDIYTAMIASWAPDVPALSAKHPNIKTMYDRVVARPKIAAVWQRNGM